MRLGDEIQVMSAVKAGVGLAVCVGLNYVLNELMDDSGLHVTMLSTHLESARANASALDAFRAISILAESMQDPSETDAIRFELCEDRGLVGHVPSILVTMVHRQLRDPVLPPWLAEHLTLVSKTKLRTVFPERSRWRTSSHTIEPGAMGEVGRLALLVQQTTHRIKAEDADAFRRSWSDLGYNALTEPGVVRCDLLQAEDGSFVTRKVFRHAAALEAHEASAHYRRWKEVASAMVAEPSSTLTLDTIHPRTSIFPFRSQWATGL